MITATPFAMIPEWLLDADVNPRAVVLYGLLRRYADKCGHCQPSRRTLARRLRCTDRTVDGLLDDLLRVGAVTVTPCFDEAGDRAPNDYICHDTACPPLTLSASGGGEADFATGGEADFAGTRAIKNENSVPKGTGPAASGDEPDPSVRDLMKHYVTTARRAGYDPTGVTKKTLAGHLLRLRDKDHKPMNVLRMALYALAMENKPPRLIDLVVGDAEVELAKKGNGNGKIR